MTWLILLLAVVLVVLTVAAVMGRIDGSLVEPTTTQSYVPLPEDRLTPDDIDALRLDTALRGYRMDQVDDVVGRLAREIRDLGERLEDVTAGLPSTAYSRATSPLASASATPALEPSEPAAAPEPLEHGGAPDETTPEP